MTNYNTEEHHGRMSVLEKMGIRPNGKKGHNTRMTEALERLATDLGTDERR